MKRKAIQLAGKTLVISLPSTWTKQWHIKKGEELELTENGPHITVTTQSQQNNKTTEIDISNNTERVTRWTLSSLHKKGYDEIGITYEKPEQVELVQEILKDLLLGFAIINQTQKRITIKSVSKDDKENFDQVLRRAFLVTLNLAENTHEQIKKGKKGRELLNLEKTNNQLTNFCQRILNKYGHENPENTTAMYTIIWNLEKIADDYKYIIQQNKNKPSKETMELFEKTNQQMRNYYELFYNFSKEKLNKQAQKRKELQKELTEHLQKEPKNATITGHLLHIVQKITDFSASTIAINQ